MIEPSKTGNVFFLDCGRIMAENEGVGVGRVGNYDTFDIIVGKLQSMRLLQKDHLIQM